MPTDEVRLTELTAIMKRQMNEPMQLNYDIAKGYYDWKLHPYGE